ncbi:MAG: glycoside hydrolase family 43 protein [Candidatus Solibacter usitatus]|nr:glycoside hydrolase family 43 protein [Candidatus Solibacter usitatus]
MLRAILFLLPLSALASGDAVFTFFRGNGETGVYLAHSSDGYHWTALNGNQPLLKPQYPGMLMRDPFLVKGPGRTWRLLWTTGWTRAKNGALTIGHASSKDLVRWSDQQLIDIPLEGARNAWAPEMVWDASRKRWIIFWASTIPGRFPDTGKTGDSGYNHRLWSMTTADFKTFSQPELYFDPGFNSIDSTLIRTGKRWTMVFKDERRDPLQKRLRLAFAATPAGHWSGVTEPFTTDWIEGPSVLKVGRDWIIYFDHYAKPQYYGAYRTRDWKSFEEISKRLTFPAEPRHGTASRISRREAVRLKSLR